VGELEAARGARVAVEEDVEDGEGRGAHVLEEEVGAQHEAAVAHSQRGLVAGVARLVGRELLGHEEEGGAAAAAAAVAVAAAVRHAGGRLLAVRALHVAEHGGQVVAEGGGRWRLTAVNKILKN